LTGKQKKEGGDMRRFTRQTVVFCLVAVLVALPAVSNYAFANDATTAATEENDPSLGEAGADLLAVRPFGIVSTAVGFTVYVVSLPFSLPGGNSKKVWDGCVVKPAKYTFKRPLGEF
jgi:hypothetical protein